MTYLIREAVPEDAKQITRLYQQLVPESPISVLPSCLANLKANPSAWLMVAEINQSVIGTALLCLCPDPMYGTQPFGVIENVIVDETARSQGIGNKLLTDLEVIARQADCSKIMISSSTKRAKAHVFFERAGYQPSKIGFVKYRKNFNL